MVIVVHNYSNHKASMLYNTYKNMFKSMFTNAALQCYEYMALLIALLTMFELKLLTITTLPLRTGT